MDRSALPTLCLCTKCFDSALGGQKRASDPLDLELQTDSCELTCGCWELNLGLLEKQKVALTTELQRQVQFYK
ncbi:hypothetical protein H671_1g3204 [Cricetulus griseus]|uniref:Uncharacterized protein n=1 Tax=Cricetulus griseus TaxID=10029 RepID=A0A061IKR7_CRIGR|nr:hypothetical protein H671_1g3204 [Cricetulus griseus]